MYVVDEIPTAILPENEGGTAIVDVENINHKIRYGKLRNTYINDINTSIRVIFLVLFAWYDILLINWPTFK